MFLNRLCVLKCYYTITVSVLVKSYFEVVKIASCSENLRLDCLHFIEKMDLTFNCSINMSFNWLQIFWQKFSILVWSALHTTFKAEIPSLGSILTQDAMGNEAPAVQSSPLMVWWKLNRERLMPDSHLLYLRAASLRWELSQPLLQSHKETHPDPLQVLSSSGERCTLQKTWPHLDFWQQRDFPGYFLPGKPLHNPDRDQEVLLNTAWSQDVNPHAWRL